MKHNWMFKIWESILATALVLCGCTGWTTDVNTAGSTSEDDHTISMNEKAFAMARSYATGSYEVTESSEETATGTISISMVRESGCVKEGETYQWKEDLNLVTQPDGDLFRYSFNGDTLVLTALNDEPDVTGQVTVLSFVGGESGKLQGVWLLVEKFAYAQYWNFGEGSIEIRVLEKENFDYMQSLFMWQLFEGLEDASMYIDADAIYYGHRVDASDYGVEILKQDNRSETFTYKGVTYELKIDSVQYKDDYLSLILSAGASECRLNYLRNDATPATCGVENDYDLHFSASAPNVVLGYSQTNEKEFGKCVKQLIAADESAATPESSASKFEKEFLSAHDYLTVYYSTEPSGENAGTIVWNFGIDGRCLKDGDGVKWVDGWYGNGQDTVQYNFSGDTLYINKSRGTAQALIGGTPGKFEGTWKMVDNVNALLWVKFEKEKATFAYDMNPDYDYMNTEFFAQLHGRLAGGSGYLEFDEEFYEPEDELENGVAIVSHTNTSEVVSVNGKTYEITLNHAHMLYRDFSVTVKSGDMVCTGRKAQIEQISQEQCSVENLDHLDDYGLVSMAYIIDEEKSFDQCLEQMMNE